MTTEGMAERFWPRVDATGDCWEWTGSRLTGYGRFHCDGVAYQAHRVAYELLVGPIPEGLDVDHLCRNRLCVNPDHLEPVSRRENIMRGYGACARRFGTRASHCLRGHLRTPDNLRPRGGCRLCDNARSAQRRARRLSLADAA